MVEKQNTVLGSVKKPYVKPEFEVIELDNQAPLLAGSPSGRASWGNDTLDVAEDNIWNNE